MRASLASVGLLFLFGCNASQGSSPTPLPDAGQGAQDARARPADARSDRAPPCFANPHTYLEIINACTDAQAISKTDDLSKMNLPDGALQPLP